MLVVLKNSDTFKYVQIDMCLIFLSSNIAVALSKFDIHFLLGKC